MNDENRQLTMDFDRVHFMAPVGGVTACGHIAERCETTRDETAVTCLACYNAVARKHEQDEEREIGPCPYCQDTGLLFDGNECYHCIGRER